MPVRTTRFFPTGSETYDERSLGKVVDYRNWSLALGRRFRSAKIWFVLRSFGVEGYQAHIRKVNQRFHISFVFTGSRRRITVHQFGRNLRRTRSGTP